MATKRAEPAPPPVVFRGEVVDLAELQDRINAWVAEGLTAWD